MGIWEKLYIVTGKQPLFGWSSFIVNISENEITVFTEEVRRTGARIKLIELAEAGMKETEIDSYEYTNPSSNCVYTHSLVPVPI